MTRACTFALFVLGAIGLWGTGAWAEAQSSSRQREIIAQAKFLTAGGDSLSLENLRGRVVLLSFWGGQEGGWCNPCNNQIKSIIQLCNGLRDEGRILEVVFVSLQSDFGGDNAILRGFGTDWTSYLWEARPFEQQQVFFNLRDQRQKLTIPTTLVLDKDGNIAERLPMHFDVKAEIEDLRRLIDAPSSR
jgi:peroxiredoxin